MHKLVLAAFLLVAIPSSVLGAPELRYEKLQAVLRHFNVESALDYSKDLTLWGGTQTRAGLETILKYVDPSRSFPRYASWSDTQLVVYKDRDTRQLVEAVIPLRFGERPLDPKGLVAGIRSALSSSTESLPLKELRVALDPGHMGGPFWDRKTGKYVSVGGRYVSEGSIALATCLLLRRELASLGAQVLITREKEEAVAETPLDQFDPAPWMASKIRQATDKPWFDALLASAPIGPRLFAAADQSPELRQLRSPGMRDGYFILGEDLAARAAKVNAFHPHLVLVVHFDASRTDRLQDRDNAIRTYVAGNVLPDEWAAPEQRFTAVRTLLDGHRWMESAVFSAAVVRGISDATGISLKNEPRDYEAVRVGGFDGIYARNLALNRLVTEGAMTYLEVLDYDYAPEFRRLAARDRRALINGAALDYSSRLDDVVEGLKRGILDYVQSVRKGSAPAIP